jgi:excinuclease ABC subunit C
VSLAARTAAGLLPTCPGAYRFRDGTGTVLYIGRAVNLRRRVISYWGDLADRPHLAPMVTRIARLEAVRCASEHEAAWLERNLLQSAIPRWNRAVGGQEVEVYLRLDSSRRSPGLSVVHAARADSPRAGAGAGQQPVQYFGPYLGGARVRLAAAGLARVFPLGYAADATAGTMADLARRHGVGGSDRDALAAGLAAVLSRDRRAVADATARLAGRLEAAAAAQAYELAGRIHAELTAVDWITCPQRVATLGQDEADIAGWADGQLVTFQVRAGRMRGWHQQAAALAEAEPLLAATPATWREFAAENAALAAALVRAT